jgi:hypothetical protein
MKTILLLVLIISLTLPAHAQGPNYCHDKESWEEWDELIEKYPHNMDIQMLHAVRIGFCKKVEDGSIDFETARVVFNDLQKKVYERAKEAKEQASEKRDL